MLLYKLNYLKAGFGGKPTSKAGVDEFCRILGTYGITATPRTRRGIDIDAGCGQLSTELNRKKKKLEMMTKDEIQDSVTGSMTHPSTVFLAIPTETERVVAQVPGSSVSDKFD